MLLNPIAINKVELPNRIVVAPMCQYSAENGNPSKWHYGHLQNLANSGAGMLMLESTAVSKRGRITLKDLMLQSESNENSFKKIVNYLKSISKIPLGLQISHAGRKGSAQIPWIRENSALNEYEKAWTTLAPSPIERKTNWPKPKSLTINQINKVILDFRNTAVRAKRIGFDCLEIHMAHGYLLHQFFSPISNVREDAYGGSLNNRCKILIEIVTEIRKVWPRDKILGARITGDDWMAGGITVEDSIFLAKKLKDQGLDYVCVSSGGVLPKTNLIFKPGYQVHLASKIRKQTGIITRTAGMITNLDQATDIIKNGSADLVAVGRRFINEPTWLTRAIKESHDIEHVPNQYKRCY